jgi:hypothetical protein
MRKSALFLCIFLQKPKTRIDPRLEINTYYLQYKGLLPDTFADERINTETPRTPAQKRESGD